MMQKIKFKQSFIRFLWIFQLLLIVIKADDGVGITKSTNQSTTLESSTTTTSPSTTPTPSTTADHGIILHPRNMKCNYSGGNIIRGQCPNSLECKPGGYCDCFSGIFSNYTFQKDYVYICKIPPGSEGCKKSRDCADYAHCYHFPRKRGQREKSECHCCDGPKFGDSEGICPERNSIQCSADVGSGDEYGSLQPRMFQILRNLSAVFLTAIISLYIIQ